MDCFVASAPRNDDKGYADARLSRACLGFAKILDFAVTLLPACPFSAWPFSPAPFALPFSCCVTLALALRAFAAFAFCFSASFSAFRSALALRRSFSARASARFFLRFFSQATHLQPIGFR